jgi:tetratricopeptide (TPR) repeat protein
MDEARRVLEALLRDDPHAFAAHLNLALAARFAGDLEGALGHFESAISGYDVPLASVGKFGALWRLGRKAEAEKVFSQLKSRSEREYVSPYLFALCAIVKGETEAAFDHFERGAEARDFLTLFVRQTAPILGYQDHPRYLALARRIWPEDFPA